MNQRLKKIFQKKGVVYRELLNKIFRLLKIYQSDSNINEKIIISPPKIKKEGPKKTVFINFNETCEKMNRQKDHLIAYLTGELGTSASIQDCGGLVLKGRYLSKGIENVLRKYIKEYVLCKTCKSAKTELQKDSFSKLLFIYCFRCFASRSVNGISKAYFAKLKRKK
jgi:translation initiation factor 2 subunit 2